MSIELVNISQGGSEMSQDEQVTLVEETASCGRGVVEYHCEDKDKHVFSTDMSAFPGLTIDFTGIPEAKRGGVASRLLCFAALYCFCNTLVNELTARGAVIKSLTGRATPTKTQDDYQRTRIKRIFIDVIVDVDKDHLPALDQCREIMDQGSLITYSLNESIEIDHVIRDSSAAAGLLN
jgi:hypothetical protein